MANQAPLIAIPQRRESPRCGDVAVVDELSLFVEKQQRKELLLLHRDFRKLELEHAPDRSKVRRQIVLETNKREDLELSLTLAQSPCFKALAESGAAGTKDVLERFAAQEELSMSCAENIKENEQAIDYMVRRLQDFQIKWLRHMNLASFSREAYDKRLEVLKNRLHVHSYRFNQSLADSAALRRDIDDLLLYRKSFYETQNHLRRQTVLIKMHQGRIVQRAHLAYDVIEETKQRTKLIVKHNDEQNRSHNFTVCEQKLMIDEHKFMRRFEAVKKRPRTHLEMEEARKSRHFTRLMDFYGVTLRRYHAAFAEIHRALPYLHDASTVFDYYKSYEEQNFHLFVLNTDLTEEVNQVQQDTLDLHGRNMELKAAAARRRKSMKERITDLRQSLRSNEETLGIWDYRWTLQQFDMNDLISDFQVIFELADAQKAAVMNLLGHTTTMDINPKNLDFMLHILERRILQLIKAKEELLILKDKKEQKKRLVQLSQVKQKVESKGGPFIPKVFMATSHPADIEDEEVEERLFTNKVFTKAELRSYCFEKISAYLEGREVEINGTSASSFIASHMSRRATKLLS